MYDANNDTPQSKWVEQNACKDHTINSIKDYISGYFWYDAEGGDNYYHSGGNLKFGYLYIK